MYYMKITKTHIDQYREMTFEEPRTLPPNRNCPVYRLRLDRVINRLAERIATTHIGDAVMLGRLSKFTKHLRNLPRIERMAS